MISLPYKRAFTLIELMIVITIIGLLSAGAFAAFNTARTGARDAKRAAQLEQIALAMELYRQKNGAYPTAVSSLLADALLNDEPKDPLTGASYTINTNVTCGGNARTVVYSDTIERANDQSLSSCTGLTALEGKYLAIVIVGPSQ